MADEARSASGHGTSFLIGLAAGTFGGLVGLGGGVVMIPLMVGVVGLVQKQAHGTSLVALVFTGLAGAATYASRGQVDLVGAGILAAAATFTSRLGARYAHVLPEWKLKRAFGLFLLLVVAVFLAKPWLSGSSAQPGAWARIAVLLATGLGTGFVSGMMGVGGGSLMVPAMVLLAGYPQLRAQGTSLLAMVPAGVVGAYTHWKLGNVVARLVPGLVPGILVGTLVGSSLALRLPDDVLRLAFGAVVAWTGLKYVRAKAPPPSVPAA